MALGRGLLAVALLISWTDSSLHIVSAQANAYTQGMNLSGMARGRVWVGLGLGTALFVPLVVAWAAGVALVLTGICILGGMIAIRQVEVALWPEGVVTGLGKYVPAAAALLGITVFTALAGWSGDPAGAHHTPAQIGWEAACGVMAAAWFSAGVMKFRQGGLSWFSSGGIGLLVAERTHRGPALLRTLRRALVARPGLCAVIGALGILAEAGGILFLWPPARLPYAGLIAGMLLLVGLFLGYWEIEWGLTLVALAVGSAALG